MSLILDALRKADAERERGAVPGLHAQPVAGDDDGDDAQGSSKRSGLAWLWPIVGALVGLLVLVAGWHVISPSAPVPPAVAPMSAPLAPPPATTAATAPQGAPAPAAPAPANAAPALAPPAPWSAPERKAEPAPTASARTSANAAATKPATPAAAASNATAGTATSASNPPPPAAETAAYVAEQLPASVRAQLPPLAFGGSIYSRTPANRSLVINGRSYREGELIAPGLVLEQIGPRAAILGFRGYRIEVPL